MGDNTVNSKVDKTNFNTIIGTTSDDIISTETTNATISSKTVTIDKINGHVGDDIINSGAGNDLAAGDTVGNEWSLVDGKWVYDPSKIIINASNDTPNDDDTIIAPNDGFVVSLNYDTEQMYITRGTTLLVLSQPLQHPRIKMIIPSLPQRNIPNVSIKLTSISPEALKDETGQTVGYQAYAAIMPKDLNALHQNLKGDLNLVTDMPVNLSLVRRTTTLYQYLIAPFLYAFDDAIQD